MIQLAKKKDKKKKKKNQRSHSEIGTITQTGRRRRSATRNMSTNKKLSISPTTSIRLIFIVVSINCCTSGAWRLFGLPSATRVGLNERTIEPTSGRSFSDHYQPFYNNVYGQAAMPNSNNNNHYHHYQPSQLLTPSTGASQLGSQPAANNLRVSSYLNEQLIGVAPEVAPNQLLLGQQQQTQSAPQPQAAALAAAPTPSPVVESSLSPTSPQSTSGHSQPNEAPAKATREPSAENNNAKQTEPSGSLQGSPSPLGKIIDSVLSSALNESLSSRSQTTTTTPSATPAAAATSTSTSSVEQSNATQQLQVAGGRLLANVASQMLKPRNKSSGNLHNGGQERKGSVASAEQQIINQHARVHLSGHSHQRLWPTKQRDNKLASEIATDPASSGSSSSSSSSFAEPFYSLLLNNFKSGITSRSSIKKAISDNKLARTLSTVTKTMGSNKYVASAGAAAALAALGLTMSKFLTPYLFAGAYSKLGEPMTMSGSSLLNSYVLNNERHYQPTGAGSSPAMIFLNPGQDPMMTSSSSVPRLMASQPSFLQQTNGDLIPANLQPFLDNQQQQLSLSQSSMSMSSPSLTTTSKQIVLAPASDINGYYGNFYDNAPPEEQPMQPYPSSIKDNIQMANTNTNNNNNNNNNNNDQMIMSAASSINSMNYPASPSAVSFMPRRSGTVSLKMDDSTKNLLYQMISRRQKEHQQQLPQVTNYLQQVTSSPNSKQADHSTTGWMAPASNVNTVGDDNPTINGQAGPSVALYYSTAGEASPLIEQQPLATVPQNSRDQQQQQQQQINQGGQLLSPTSSSSSFRSSKQQLDESYSSDNKKQWLTPARRQQQEQEPQHQLRSVGGQARLDSRGWQSIQQQPTDASSKQPAGPDTATYQAVNLRQNTTANANERDLRDVHWQRKGISRPLKTSTSSKTSSSMTNTKTAKVYIKQRRPVVKSVVGEFQLNSSSPTAQTINYGLALDRPATGEENRQQQQQAPLLFDLQQPPEATSTQSGDNNRLHQHLNHLRQQQQQQEDDYDKQNAIKVIEMNGNNRTQQLVDPMEVVVLPASSSLSSPGNNEDIISTSPSSMSLSLSLGDAAGDNRPDVQDNSSSNRNHRDHLQSDNQSAESPPSRAFRGPVAGSIVGGLSSGQLAAETR